MPLTINASARCFDKLNMTDEKNGVVPNILFSVIPSVVEESRGNEFFLIPRGRAYADKNSALLQFIL